MADPSIPPEGWSVLWWLVGPGAIGAAAMAAGRWVFGRRLETPAPAAQIAPPPIDIISSHWMSHHILEAHQKLDHISGIVDALAVHMGEAILHMDIISKQLKTVLNARRKRRERKKP